VMDPTNELTALRLRFPKANFSYAPTPGHKKCGGTGIVPARTLPSGTHMNESPCVCLFFGPNTSWLAPLVAESAKKALEELRDRR
jgi:hypothetical protein